MVITAALSEIDTKGYAIVTLLHCQSSAFTFHDSGIALSPELCESHV